MFTDNQLWGLVLTYMGIVVAACIGNLGDPHSETNDLDNILQFPSKATREATINKARIDLYQRLAKK